MREVNEIERDKAKASGMLQSAFIRDEKMFEMGLIEPVYENSGWGEKMFDSIWTGKSHHEYGRKYEW